ncbi:flagellar hook-basal body complex protein [Niallia sp. Krafla_26]
MPKPGNNATADEVEEYSKYISYIGTIDLKAKTPLDPAQGTPIEVGEINITPETQPLHILNFVDGKIPYDESLRNFSFEIPTGLINDEETVADESKQMVNLQFDFSSLSQYEGATTALINPNGSIEGALESFSIGSGGEITGVYSNGELVILGQLAIAKFSNSSGLMNAGGNLFQESINSGNPDIDVPGVGRGSLSAGSLEMSNVDLSEEFTEMITAQRGFQANTRIITTSDEILQELVNLKR